VKNGRIREDAGSMRGRAPPSGRSFDTLDPRLEPRGGAANVHDEESALSAFLGRFAAFEQSGGHDPIGAAPSLGAAKA
jgi:hypothetical protein